jgi:signal peptidase I
MIRQLPTGSFKGISLMMFAIALLWGCDASEIVASIANTDRQYSYRVPGGEMEPTLKIGERVQILATSAHSSRPYIGEIVLSHPPVGWDLELCGPTPHTVRVGAGACSEPEHERSSVEFLNRIVAGPGDVIAIREGHVIRNEVRERDHYIRPCRGVPECGFPVAIRIPPGHWFMMGDNRGESDDSRFWGPVPTSWIVGAVVLDQRQNKINGNVADN